jgi:hypothetical protein
MVEHFETSCKTGDLRRVTVPKGLSAQDIKSIAGHRALGQTVEIYAVEFDSSVDSRR